MKPVIIIATVFVLIIFTPTLANGDEYAEKWKQYVESYKEYMETYKVWAHDTINFYKSQLLESNKSLEILKDENNNLKFKNNLLSAQLESVNTQSDKAFDALEAYQKYADEIDSYFDEEKLKPKTTIIDQKINWDVSDSKGNLYFWSMPIESYESTIRATEPYKFLKLENTSTGDVYTVRDHTLFVKTSFTNIIDGVYDNSKNDYDFAYEVWYIVSQLTTYSYDIGEDPRWALETLSRGGGDCEDTAILIADMLKSSKHTKNWKIQLVYFDAYNPNDPKTMNHVAVHIDDGTYNYFIESTAKDDPYAWQDGIQGWYFEV